MSFSFEGQNKKCFGFFDFQKIQEGIGQKEC